MVEVTTIPQGKLGKGSCDPCLCLTPEMKQAIEDNSEKASILPILDEDGVTILGFNIDGDDYLLPLAADPVTYTLVQEGDVLTFTGSDDSTQTVTIVHPDDEDTVLGDPLPDATTGIVTWPVLNADGTTTGDTRTGDFSAFLSSPHPAIAASGDATANYDAVADTWTIGFADTDTFATVSDSTVTDAAGNSVTVPAGSTYNPATNEITTSDGQVVALMVDTDTDTFATQNADGDLVLADGTIVPLVVDTDTDRVNQLTINADGSVTSQIVDIDGNAVGSPVVIPAPAVDAPAVHNGDYTATTDGVTVSTQNLVSTTVNNSGNTGSHEIRRNYRDTETGATFRVTENSMPRSEVRTLSNAITIDSTTPLVGNSILIDTFSFPSNLATRRVIHISPLHIRKFDFVGFGNFGLQLTNTTTGESRPVGGQLAYASLGLHTDGSGHYDEESWSGQQFFNDVEGNNDYELHLILDDATAFITQGSMQLNQINVGTITAMRHEVITA